MDAVTSSVGCGGGLTALSKSRSISRALFSDRAPVGSRNLLLAADLRSLLLSEAGI